MNSRRVTRVVVLLVVVAMFALGADAALATTPNDVQYHPAAALTPPPQPTGVKGSQTQKSVPATPPSGALPFTGLDLGVISGVGALLIAGGFALRKLGHTSSQ